MTLPQGWWLQVEQTFCLQCNRMTGCHQYQGHFSCDVCGQLTGFWLPMPPFSFINPEGVRDIEGVKRWKVGGSGLEPVPFKLKGENEQSRPGVL